MDSSGSIGSQNFDKIKSFLSDLVGELEVDKGVVRVGIVQFSSDVELEFHLNEYNQRLITNISIILNHLVN